MVVSVAFLIEMIFLGVSNHKRFAQNGQEKKQKSRKIMKTYQKVIFSVNIFPVKSLVN